jgi:hypothetical protein
MLGGICMSTSNAPAREGGSVRERIARAQALLEEVLRLVDENVDAPEIGAQLEDVIQQLKGCAS